MKKLYALILAAALCLGLAACGGSTSANVPTKGAPKAATSQAVEEPEPLSEEELVKMRLFVSGTEELVDSYEKVTNDVLKASRKVGCFFTSEYDDVRDLDLEAFLAYCGVGQELKDGENNMEFLEFVKAAGYGEDKEWARLSGAPLPVWRYRTDDIDALLKEYAGITIDDLRENWREAETMVYVQEYHSFYNTTSDVDFNVFSPSHGEKTSDSMTLYGEMLDKGPHALTLKKAGNVWHIVSYVSMELPERFKFTGEEFVGEWRDSVSESAVAYVTEGEKAGVYNVTVIWPQDDALTLQWAMEARTNAEEKTLSYENGVKSEIRSFEQADDEENVLWKDGKGSLQISDGVLTWHDEGEPDSDNCKFVKAE